jgi:hypothetical protein
MAVLSSIRDVTADKGCNTQNPVQLCEIDMDNYVSGANHSIKEYALCDMRMACSLNRVTELLPDGSSLAARGIDAERLKGSTVRGGSS